jgi:hypothetical protein
MEEKLIAVYLYFLLLIKNCTDFSKISKAVSFLGYFL